MIVTLRESYPQPAAVLVKRTVRRSRAREGVAGAPTSSSAEAPACPRRPRFEGRGLGEGRADLARGCSRFTGRITLAAGFTVVELMVAVSLMTLIVLALFGVFNQTQKALRSNVTQVDVMESGRAAMDLMTQELRELSASSMTKVTNFAIMSSALTPGRYEFSTGPRTNVLQDFFFLTHLGKDWSGVGYRLLPPTNQGAFGVGVLHRFADHAHVRELWTNTMVAQFQLAPRTNLQQVTDGIVHLKLDVFDSEGMQMTFRTNKYTNVSLTRFGAVFVSNALPSYVELEMGVLEPQTLEQFRSMPNTEAARGFLEKQTAKIHLFRQRIRIRTAPQ